MNEEQNNTNKKGLLPKPVKYVLFALLISVVGFVGLNLWNDRDTINIEQGNEPTAERVAEIKQEEPEAIQRQGSFSGLNNYSAAGAVKIVEVDGVQTLAFDESFDTQNGPDLKVYLSENNVQSGEDLGEFVSLGSIKSRTGEQVYTLPDNVDDFKSVVIWCRAFSAAFGAADL